MVVAIEFVLKNLGFRIGFNVYINSIFAWMSAWIWFSVISAIAFRAMGIMQHTLLVLRQEIEHQRDEINHLANHDHLTGLPTMRLAQDRLEMAIHYAERNNEKVAILFIYLDGLKQVNDRLGHECRDNALKEAARRMSQMVRTDDTVARRSGDEFLIILEGVNDLYYISTIAEKMIAAIAQPMVYQDTSLPPS